MARGIHEEGLQAPYVFVPGSMPTHTYVSPRSHDAENRVEEYLQGRAGRALAVAGPSKSGKTVLVRKVLADRAHCWIDGTWIKTAQDFWQAVAGILEVPTLHGDLEHASTVQHPDTIGGSAGIPSLASFSGRTDLGLESRQGSATFDITSVPVLSGALRRLTELHRPVVIDNFQKIPQEVQKDLLNGLLSFLFDGGRLVLICHREDDPVRAESSMAGRTELLLMEPWQPSELREIAEAGFRALNVSDPDNAAGRLSREAFGSPHIMQDLCLGLCRLNDISRSLRDIQRVGPPAAWDLFFRKRYVSDWQGTLERLARSPGSGSIPRRQLLDGRPANLDKAVMHAVGVGETKCAFDSDEIRTLLSRVLKGAQPTRRQVRQVLARIGTRARELQQNCLDFDSERDVLLVVDPTFSFFLRWGTRLYEDQEPSTQEVPRSGFTGVASDAVAAYATDAGVEWPPVQDDLGGGSRT